MADNNIELEITVLEHNLRSIQVLNWPMPLTLYADEEAQRLTNIYVPQPYLPAVNKFRQQEKELADIICPLIALAVPLGEFGGLSNGGYNTAIAWHNAISGWGRVTEGLREKAIEEGYLRTTTLGQNTIYSPTEKAVRALCNQRSERFLFPLSLHTGVSIGIGPHLENHPTFKEVEGIADDAIRIYTPK